MTLSELWAEYQLAQSHLRGQPPGADFDAGVSYVRAIEVAVRSRTPNPAAGASTNVTPQSERFDDVTPSSSEPEGDPYQSGRTALRAGDIDRYGGFNTAARVGDDLEGHEVLQNAFLKAVGKVSTRGTGPASRNNPSIALSEQTHARVDAAQQRLGLRDPKRLATMTYDEVIERNTQALLEAGVEHSQTQMIKREALRYAAALLDQPKAFPAGKASSSTDATPPPTPLKAAPAAGATATISTELQKPVSAPEPPVSLETVAPAKASPETASPLQGGSRPTAGQRPVSEGQQGRRFGGLQDAPAVRRMVGVPDMSPTTGAPASRGAARLGAGLQAAGEFVGGLLDSLGSLNRKRQRESEIARLTTEVEEWRSTNPTEGVLIVLSWEQAEGTHNPGVPDPPATLLSGTAHKGGRTQDEAVLQFQSTRWWAQGPTSSRHHLLPNTFHWLPPLRPE
jgi:hypothetical protein